MITSWGFIYLGPGSDPAAHRIDIQRGGLRTVLVPVPEPAAAVQAAIALVEEGAQLIELCGAFGPVWTARIIAAIGGRIPVGAVGYGAESVAKLSAALA